MASRILTFVSCTLCFSFLCILTIIGLTSIMIGFVGLGLYIPTLINHNAYSRNTCYIIDHQYNICQQENEFSCYSVMWAVEYIVLNQTSEHYIFSTITETYKTPIEALNRLKKYLDTGNYTCYYDNVHVSNVKWDKQPSPRPYLIMMVVGFALTVIYFIVIGSIAIYRCRRE